MDKSIFAPLPVQTRLFPSLDVPPLFTTNAYSQPHGLRPLQKGQPLLAALAIYSRLHLRHWYTLLLCQKLDIYHTCPNCVCPGSLDLFCLTCNKIPCSSTISFVNNVILSANAAMTSYNSSFSLLQDVVFFRSIYCRITHTI